MPHLQERLNTALAGRYEVDGKLGAGGMSTVFLAKDLKHHRQVAIKVLKPELAAAIGADRFLQEIRVTASFTHPHILTLHDSGQADGLLYYVMPYIDGETLRDRLKKEKQLPIADAVNIACDIARALAYAHEKLVLHRDIKPENILLSGGEAIVADFGIASAIEDRKGLTATGMVVGTPAYMSPEQASADELDARSDLYSLGCVFYEMLAGEAPFTGPTAQAISSKRLSTAVPRLSTVRETVPTPVENAVTKLLSRLPADRYSTAVQFAEEITLSSRTTTENRAPDTKRTADKIMLAVLPFENMSGDLEQEFFSDGMTEEMISQIVILNPRQLGVIARTSAMSYKNTEKSVAQIGRELGVDYLVKGSVRHAGDQVRITAQLIQIADQTHLWAENYQRGMSDIFAIQSEVAKRVAHSLAVELLPASIAESARVPTTNPRAHEAYLRGRYYWNKRNEEATRKGIDCFEEAIRIDPSYAGPYVGLSDCLSVLADHGHSHPGEAMQKAREAVLKALDLDETLPEAHCSYAYVLHVVDWKWREAEAEYLRAIEVSPGLATAHHGYANLLATMGRLEEALDQMRRAQELDPLSLMINTILGELSYLNRQYDQATEHLLRTLELDPDFEAAHFHLAILYELRSMYDEAIAECQKASSLSGGAVLHRLALASCYASAGRTKESRETLHDVLSSTEGSFVPMDSLATVYAALGENDRAFECLEKIYEQRSVELVYLGTNPRFKKLHSDPRFADLSRRVGLPVQPPTG